MSSASFYEWFAEDLARFAHAKQTDLAGQPYVGHLERVAARVTTSDARIVAWLHDLVEDQPRYAPVLLVFPERIRTAVHAMTRQPGEEYAAFIERAIANPLAKQVKYADLLDNSDPARAAQLPPEKAARLAARYEKAKARILSAD